MKFKINFGKNGKISNALDSFRQFIDILLTFMRTALDNGHKEFEITVHTDFLSKVDN